MDRRWIEKAIVAATDVGFEELKSWVIIFSYFCLRPVTFVCFMLQSFETFVEMWSQIDTHYKEVSF